MKITLVTAGALALGLLAPLSVSAQQAQPQPGYQMQRTTPDEPTMQHRWQKRLGRLNLSGDQQQRIASIIHGFAQSHPAGSPPDRAGNRALRQQILSVLSPDQRQQYHQMIQQERAGMQQRHAQNGQGQQGPAPQYGDPRDQQQGPPPDQGQGPPPDYQGQGPPPDQGQGPPPDYQGPPDQGQGPPPDQGQGPPPDQGQGPPPDQGQGPPPDYQGPSDQGQGPPPDQGQGPPPDQGPPPA